MQCHPCSSLSFKVLVTVTAEVASSGPVVPATHSKKRCTDCRWAYAELFKRKDKHLTTDDKAAPEDLDSPGLIADFGRTLAEPGETRALSRQFSLRARWRLSSQGG